ncbi:MAG: histidinol-phosphatase, partial [Oscillospiraceae bacterium]|nr:histidinol-phosphatase [Oscillospiraceae bacterium]
HRYLSYYEELLTKEKLDYLILGEHFYLDAHKEMHNIYFAQSTEDYLDYARAIEAALKTGYFRMVAHPDLFTLTRFAWDRNCDEAAERIIEAADRSGVILEYNANGLRRGVHDYPDGPRLMYPHPKFWEKVVGSGIPVVIGSDCHEAKQVWDGCMPTARRMLLDLGITPLDYVEGLGPKL